MKYGIKNAPYWGGEVRVCEPNTNNILERHAFKPFQEEWSIDLKPGVYKIEVWDDLREQIISITDDLVISEGKEWNHFDPRETEA